MAGSRARGKAIGAAEKTRKLLGKSAAEAVAILVALMRDEAQKPELRMKAAESILDRVCGKAGSTPSSTGDVIPDCVRFEGELEAWSR
jgi:hypothetical protein